MDNMHAGGYYSGSMGTPPKTPGSTPQLSYQKLGSAPFIPGYFTPPDSRENSPSLGGTSPNPQTQSTFLLPPTPGTPPNPSSDEETFFQYPRKMLPGPQCQKIFPATLQTNRSFGSLQPTPELTEDASFATTPERLSGAQTILGTFGRVESRRYQKQDTPESLPPTVTSKRSLKRYKSNASTIVPLPSTVYVPGVGDNVSTIASHEIENERHSYHDREQRSHFSVCDTPPMSAKSPSISSPFLPVEPDTPVISTPNFPRPYDQTSMVSSQAGLVGLWGSAQRSGTVVENAVNSGRTYVLNMYRQTPLYKSEHSSALPEHLTFGSDSRTPFYTLYAMREDAADDTFNELSFLRRNPLSGLETSVITLGLESPSQGMHPAEDGLITLIYPKEAVLSAMSPPTPIFQDEAGQTLGPRRIRGNEERAREAIQKAYATECCRLSWNAQRKRYYLYHPGVAACGDAYLVDIQGEVGFDSVGAKGTIKLLNVDTNETIAELDFGRSALFVNTSATSKIPSAYIVDVAVATVLTVAVVEGRRIRMSQSQFSMPMARHIGRECGQKRRWRKCFSAFFKALCF